MALLSQPRPGLSGQMPKQNPLTAIGGVRQGVAPRFPIAPTGNGINTIRPQQYGQPAGPTPYPSGGPAPYPGLGGASGGQQQYYQGAGSTAPVYGNTPAQPMQNNQHALNGYVAPSMPAGGQAKAFNPFGIGYGSNSGYNPQAGMHYGVNYGAGGGVNFITDPSKTTYISARTAPTAWTSGGSDGRIGTGVPQGAYSGLGGGVGAGLGGVGGVGPGGAGSQIGQQLQNDLNAANAANEARYQQALQTNEQGRTDQLNNINQGYGGILGTIGQNKTDQMGFLNGVLGQQQGLASGLGGTQHEQENRRLAAQLGSNQQSLVGRGLGNSTVVDSMAKGYQSESAFNQRAIDEENARLQLGILGQYGQQGGNILANTGNQMVNAQTGQVGATGNILAQNQAQRVGLIESKTDQGPNTAAYLNLLSQAGSQGGYGAGGAMGLGSGRGNGGGGGFSLGANLDQGGNDQSQNPLYQYLQYLTSQQQGQNQQGQSSYGLSNIPYAPAGGYSSSAGGGLSNIPYAPAGGYGNTNNQPSAPGDYNSTPSTEQMAQALQNLGLNINTSNPQYVAAMYQLHVLGGQAAA